MTDRKRLTLSLPIEDWENLEAEALAHDESIGIYAARLLRGCINPSMDIHRDVPTSVSASQYTTLREWVILKGLAVPDTCTTRVAVLLWAREKGYPR